jgi:hypothetical protein
VATNISFVQKFKEIQRSLHACYVCAGSLNSSSAIFCSKNAHVYLKVGFFTSIFPWL